MYLARLRCRRRILEAEKLEKKRIKTIQESNEGQKTCSGLPCCQITGHRKQDGDEYYGSGGGDKLCGVREVVVSNVGADISQPDI